MGFWVGSDGGVGAERLNAEFRFGTGVGTGAGGTVRDAAGGEEEKSNMSFNPFTAAGLDMRGDMLGAELKPPKPLDELNVRWTCEDCNGG